MLIIKVFRGLQASIVDVEAAFFSGKLHEEIYMKIPEGMMSANEDSRLQLKGTIYSLVQSSI